MVSFVLVVAALQAASSGSDVKAGVDAWARGDHAAAVAAWRALSDGGDPHAQFNLAQAYKLGRGVPADMGQAIDLYRRARHGATVRVLPSTLPATLSA